MPPYSEWLGKGSYGLQILQRAESQSTQVQGQVGRRKRTKRISKPETRAAQGHTRRKKPAKEQMCSLRGTGRDANQISQDEKS